MENVFEGSCRLIFQSLNRAETPSASIYENIFVARRNRFKFPCWRGFSNWKRLEQTATSTISAGEKNLHFSRRGGKTLIQNYVDSIAGPWLSRETRERRERERQGEKESEELARNAAKCFYYSSLSRARGTARTKANVYGVFISCTFRRRGENQKTGSIPEPSFYSVFGISFSLSLSPFLRCSEETRSKLATIGFWIVRSKTQEEPKKVKGMLLYRVS